MDLLNNLALGFGVAFTLQNLACAFGGAWLGLLVGLLPGPGLVAAIAMLMPAAVALGPTSALILLGAWFNISNYHPLVDHFAYIRPSRLSYWIFLSSW